MDYWFEIKKTILEILRDRGYDISKEKHILNMKLEDFEDFYNKSLNYYKTDNPHTKNYENLEISLLFNDKIYYHIFDKTEENNMKTIITYFIIPEDKNICTKDINKFKEKTIMSDNYFVSDAILIHNDPISSYVKKELSKMTQHIFNIIVFNANELLFNPTKYIDCPQYILLDDTEKIQLMSTLKCKLSDFLIIKQTDPIIKYYGWKRGQIIKIIRDDYKYNILSPQSINYRIII